MAMDSYGVNKIVNSKVTIALKDKGEYLRNRDIVINLKVSETRAVSVLKNFMSPTGTIVNVSIGNADNSPWDYNSSAEFAGHADFQHSQHTLRCFDSVFLNETTQFIIGSGMELPVTTTIEATLTLSEILREENVNKYLNKQMRLRPYLHYILMEIEPVSHSNTAVSLIVGDLLAYLSSKGFQSLPILSLESATNSALEGSSEKPILITVLTQSLTDWENLTRQTEFILFFAKKLRITYCHVLDRTDIFESLGNDMTRSISGLSFIVVHLQAQDKGSATELLSGIRRHVAAVRKDNSCRLVTFGQVDTTPAASSNSNKREYLLIYQWKMTSFASMRQAGVWFDQYLVKIYYQRPDLTNSPLLPSGLAKIQCVSVVFHYLSSQVIYLLTILILRYCYVF